MEKKVNIRRIAELSDTSASTVSRVLSGKVSGVKISEATKERIIAVCRQLDYQPSIHAARLFSRESGIVGFLPVREMFIEDDNLARSIGGVYSRLHTGGYRCLPVVYDDAFVDSKEYLNLFKRQEIDALLVWGAGDTYSWLDELSATGKPFMLLANRYKDYPSVTCDQKHGVAVMTGHCRERGARRFVYVSLTSGDSSDQRREGFIAATQGCEISIVEGGMHISDGIAAAKAAMSFKPDAIICGNDRLAIGVQKALLELGVRIPEDIMLTGGDNIELGQFCQVPLTTFDQMSGLCAERGVDILLGHLKSNTPLSSEVIAPEFHVRASA
ncbi:MAG: LacI family DNA-binding transcriptional regulator [Victivallales bacterium]|nr:LacI family DNA-binding transcriptional regulator [Victivallales bacterium]